MIKRAELLGIEPTSYVSQATAQGQPPFHRQLLIRDEARLLLRLADDQFQFLVNTRQLTAIRIAGEERFDSRDLDHLIDSYKITASRRPR